MPLYTFSCENSHTIERNVPVAQRGMVITCPHCALQMRRHFGRTFIAKRGPQWGKMESGGRLVPRQPTHR